MAASPPPTDPQAPAQPVTLAAVYRLFFYVGMFSFGGGMTAWFHREVVLIRRWMGEDEFFSGYSLAQVLPGVNSTNMAVYIGQHVRGAVGAIVALVAVLTGPVLVVIVVAALYASLTQIPGFSAAMSGLAASAIGMLFRMALTSARGCLRKADNRHNAAALLVLAATFVAVGVMRWPLVPVVAVIAPLSVAAAWPRKPRIDANSVAGSHDA
jgi:chromate transporter